MKSKAQRPTKKTEEQESSKERSAREAIYSKCRFAADFKSTVKYKSTAEYSSSTEWPWQIKENWAQDPFDLVNIICPTKVQILLYKK